MYGNVYHIIFDKKLPHKLAEFSCYIHVYMYCHNPCMITISFKQHTECHQLKYAEHTSAMN